MSSRTHSVWDEPPLHTDVCMDGPSSLKNKRVNFVLKEKKREGWGQSSEGGVGSELRNCVKVEVDVLGSRP